MLHGSVVFQTVLLLVSNALALNLTVPVQNEVIDSTKPFMVEWVSAKSDPSEISIDIAYATANNAYMLDNLATDVNSSDGSITVHWPADIPSNMDKYQLVFSNSSNDSIFSHSDSFILTGETQPANKSGGGLSAGEKAAIGVLVPLTVLAILALCYYMHRRYTKGMATQIALEKGDQPPGRAELEGSHPFRGFLHRFRPELSGSHEAHAEKDKTLIEMPNQAHNEMPAVNSSPVEMASPTWQTPPSAQKAASPVEMPSPGPVAIIEGMSGVLDRVASPATEEASSTGTRPQSSATTEHSGVSMMLAKAKKLEECSEIQTVGSGITVTRKPVDTCRKEVPGRQMPTESTVSTASPTVMGSDVECADLRHGQQLGKGTEIEESMPRSTSVASRAGHVSRPAQEQSLDVTASSSETNAKQEEQDAYVGNEAEDEMTQEPEGDIF